MENTQEEVITALRTAKGIAYYGEILLEVCSYESDDITLRKAAQRQADQLLPSGDIVNTLCNIDNLQNAFANKLRAKFQQVFTGPISATDELNVNLVGMLPFKVPPHCLVENGEIGLCHLNTSEEGDMRIILDSERAAIRDAISNTVFREAVVKEAQSKGVFFSSLIGLGMNRNASEFKNMFTDIHQSGVVTVFDTNYRSYVMEHCYPQHNYRPASEMMMEIIPHVDVLVAGTEDIFSLEPDKERSVQRVQREFFGMARPSSLCILKAGRDGAHWRDDLSTWHHVSAIPIKIRSTTGAGDAFNAGVLFALRQGKTFEEAVIFANAVAAKIVESDQSTLSTSEAIDSISFF